MPVANLVRPIIIIFDTRVAFPTSVMKKHLLFKHTGMVSHGKIVFDTKLNLIAEPPMNSVARKKTPMLSAGVINGIRP